MTKDELHTRLIALFGEVHTTRKAAAALGVSSRAVERWLSGDRGIPGPVIAWLKTQDQLEAEREGFLEALRNQAEKAYQHKMDVAYRGKLDEFM